MKLQETIRRILREELSSRVRRRVPYDEMEKEFLESFEASYDLTKRRKISQINFLDELIYTTVTMMMDGIHWRFVSTFPEDEFWYDDIHTELENHYKDRITQMYNERKGINESVLKEETEVSLFVRRRFSLEDLEWLVNDVKEMIDDGESLDTAIYDGVREFIKSKNFSDIDEFGLDADYWSSYLNYERPLVRYVKNKLNIQESILEERNSTMIRIFRRADAEKIDEIFNGGLKTMMERYLQNKHNWRLMNFYKFKTSVIQYVIVDLCVNYSDICYGSGDFHNQVSEFLLNNYSDKIEQKWEEINSGDINESVLKEELSARVRRRVSAIDWQIGFAVKEVARQRTNICNMGESGYIETVIEKTIDSMYWDFFSDMDDNSDEWTSAYHYMERYINNNFVNKLRENYQLNCGD